MAYTAVRSCRSLSTFRTNRTDQIFKAEYWSRRFLQNVVSRLLKICSQDDILSQRNSVGCYSVSILSSPCTVALTEASSHRKACNRRSLKFLVTLQFKLVCFSKFSEFPSDSGCLCHTATALRDKTKWTPCISMPFLLKIRKICESRGCYGGDSKLLSCCCKFF